MEEKTIIMDESAINRAITRMAYQIIERNKGVENLVIVGIFSRGVEIAQRITNKIFLVEGTEIPIGFLDITPHRDDLKTDSDYKDLTRIDFDYTGRIVILVDDVIYTGRSARAAIDGLMKKWRPQSVQLAVLIDRGHRELPFRPDYVGKNVPTSKHEQIKVSVKERDGVDKVAILTGGQQ